VVGLCWTVFGIIIYCSLCCVVCGAVYSEWFVCVRVYFGIIMYCSLCCVVCGSVYSEWWVCVGVYLEL